jgi:hypothetical protein
MPRLRLGLRLSPRLRLRLTFKPGLRLRLRVVGLKNKEKIHFAQQSTIQFIGENFATANKPYKYKSPIS